MKTVAVTTNFNIPEKTNVAVEVINKLLNCGTTVYLPAYAKNSPVSDLEKKGNIVFRENAELLDGADMVTVIGGDGSILEAARKASKAQIPILGINKGRLGYMCELEVSELDRIEEIVRGEFRIEERSMLNVDHISRDKIVYSCLALNDAVITNGSVSRLIDLQLSANGTVIGSYRADGIIVCTPTGSTAYSISAGGPVLDPALPCICVTPICAHSLAARPTVFPETAVLEVKNTCVREPFIFLTVDGRINLKLNKYDVVRVTHSELTSKLIRVKPSRFYSDLYKKLENI